MAATQAVFDIKAGLTARAKERRHARTWLLRLLAPAVALWAALAVFAVLGAPAAPGEGVVCTDDTTLPYSVRTGACVALRLRRPPFPRAPHIRVCTLCSIIRLKRSRQHDGRPATAGAIDAGLNCVPLACTEGVDADWADSDCCAVPENAGCAPGYALSFVQPATDPAGFDGACTEAVALAGAVGGDLSAARPRGRKLAFDGARYAPRAARAPTPSAFRAPWHCRLYVTCWVC